MNKNVVIKCIPAVFSSWLFVLSCLETLHTGAPLDTLSAALLNFSLSSDTCTEGLPLQCCML